LITFDEARKAAQAELDGMSARAFGGLVFVLLDSETLTEPYGWVFFYDSQQHVESQAFDDSLLRNAPLLVLRDTGEVRLPGTARSTEYYLGPYRAAHRDGLSPTDVVTPR
jgi:hypothetical protein